MILDKIARRHRSHWKMVFFWFIGAFCLLLGSMIAGQLEKTIGVTDLTYGFALVLALVLFLIGGLMWITVALAMKVVHEE